MARKRLARFSDSQSCRLDFPAPNPMNQSESMRADGACCDCRGISQRSVASFCGVIAWHRAIAVGRVIVVWHRAIVAGSGVRVWQRALAGDYGVSGRSDSGSGRLHETAVGIVTAGDDGVCVGC